MVLPFHGGELARDFGGLDQNTRTLLENFAGE